jgi:hypothetical protein
LIGSPKSPLLQIAALVAVVDSQQDLQGFLLERVALVMINATLDIFQDLEGPTTGNITAEIFGWGGVNSSVIGDRWSLQLCWGKELRSWEDGTQKVKIKMMALLPLVT